MTAVVNVVTTIVIDGLFIYWCQIFADVVGFFTKAITSTGAKKGELFFGDLSTQVKNINVTADIKVDTGSNLSWGYVVMRLMNMFSSRHQGDYGDCGRDSPAHSISLSLLESSA
ncbi:uncharacterized protein LOC110708574 isoform X1 [Chenopodium quinoa]|uniref:uncharacterized protein LOC110708574 isoform X1 n=1 Tax=Chenopodium quinoa TaxID=63459 RepID=UPI000B76FFD1|nr:uncharacterized protein LOC110708574 isoform X1 [Chenopodium quinoa]